MAHRSKTSIYVIADDTDVLILQLHFCSKQQLACSLVMMGISSGRKWVKFQRSATKKPSWDHWRHFACSSAVWMWHRIRIVKHWKRNCTESPKFWREKPQHTWQYRRKCTTLDISAFLSLCPVIGITRRWIWHPCAIDKWYGPSLITSWPSASKLRVLCPQQTKHTCIFCIELICKLLSEDVLCMDTDPPDLNPLQYDEPCMLKTNWNPYLSL